MKYKNIKKIITIMCIMTSGQVLDTIQFCSYSILDIVVYRFSVKVPNLS